MAATHLSLVPGGEQEPDHDELSARLFGGNVLVGAGVADGAAIALTDFRIQPTGSAGCCCSIAAPPRGRPAA